MNVATKNQLRMEIRALRRVGAQMANVMFNISQPSWTIDMHTRDLCKNLQKEYDSINRQERIK